MPDAPIDADRGGDDADKEVVERERAELREFVDGLSLDEIKSGGWFTQLLAHALSSYTEKATWQYFQERYAGVPADAIITPVARENRIEVRVQFVRVIDFPGYPYNYEFDYTAKSTAFLSFK